MTEKNMINITVTMNREERKNLKQITLNNDITGFGIY